MISPAGGRGGHGGGSGSGSGSRKSRKRIRRSRPRNTAVALQGGRVVKASAGNTGGDVLPFRLLGDAPEQGGDKASKKQLITEAELCQGVP